MSKEIACNDVVAGCSFTAEGGTEDEVLDKVARHAEHDHGVREITPELFARVKAAVKDR